MSAKGAFSAPPFKGKNHRIQAARGARFARCLESVEQFATLVSVDAQVDTDEPDYSEDGVDLTLIRWMLSLTPAERLNVLQGFADSLAEIRARNGIA